MNEKPLSKERALFVFGRFKLSDFQIDCIKLETFPKQLSINNLMEDTQPVVRANSEVAYRETSMLIAILGF